jgi:hypothetical protein
MRCNKRIVGRSCLTICKTLFVIEPPSVEANGWDDGVFVTASHQEDGVYTPG